MGFASASVLALAILVHAFARPIGMPAASPVNTAQIDVSKVDQRIQQDVDARIAAAVTKAVADTEARQNQKLTKMLEAGRVSAPRRLSHRSAGRSLLRSADEPFDGGQQRCCARKSRPMKNFVVLCLVACALPAGSMADKPKVSRAIVKSVEESTDQKLQALFSDNPVQVQVLGLTQGAISTDTAWSL